MQVPITTKQSHEIPEVAAFEQAKATLESFRSANQQFFQIYDAMIEEYNQKREAADKVVRAEDVRCGDWDQYQRFTKYDAEKAYSSLGRETFIEVGGVVRNKAELKLDAKKFEMSIAQGRVPAEVAEECTTIESRYHAPLVAVVL